MPYCAYVVKPKKNTSSAPVKNTFTKKKKMNARIITENLTKEEINEAFTLGEYKKGDFDVQGIQYKMYGKGDNIWIEFEERFEFCHLVFVVIDLLEVSRTKTQRDVKGFVDTSKTNKITESLNDDRVCFYLSEALKKGLRENEEVYLDIVNIVTTSNKNYTVDIDNLFSYISENRNKFEEPELNTKDYELIGEGEYLYEKGNFEKEYIEELKKR